MSILLTASTAGLADETVLLRGVPDLEGPVVQHSPSQEPVESGSPVTISATVTDNVGVKYVLVNYRSAGSKEYRQAAMQLLGNNLFSATIPALHVQNASVEYYIEAVDLSGNTVLRGLDFQPMIIAISPHSPAKVTDQTVALQPQSISPAATTSRQKSNDWIWWTVGAVVAGSAAYAFTRGGGSGGDEPSTGTIVITSPSPE